MGERTEFEPGDKAPNDGIYMEVGEASFHTEIQDPKQIRLKKARHFRRRPTKIANGKRNHTLLHTK